jgi:hypothetical protein
LPEQERHLIAICCGIPVVTALWVATVTPAAFLRYVIMAAPIGCLLSAWCFVRVAGRRPHLAVAAAALMVITPLFSIPLRGFLKPPAWSRTGDVVRSELPFLVSDIFRQRPDPNRAVIEWLRQHASPEDEILINYEDAPLIFYLPNPIRGGIAAFRAEDTFKPPAFAVIRRSVGFVHWPVFSREIERYEWEPVELQAPDIMWGNNPDPIGHIQDPAAAKPLLFARRVDAARP